nr:bifunctional phosphopantothenoylcysteine decarboxylase/phosphopantothenate--cysteine ligase CoaBC [Solirubrobacterales bacterium]
TQHNAEALRRRGVRVIEPEVGPLASRGERGAGRLPDPEALLAELEAALGGVVDSWAGLRVLVSAGGTREAIDGVRFIGNRSSGRMGIALAEAAVRRGASVELVAANVSLPSAAAIARQDVESAGDLGAALSGRFEACDVLLMAAAVADFRPDATHEGKLSREGEAELALRLEPTEDVLATLAARRAPNQVLVGFAAEHGQESIERARRKLARKAVDAIVFNDVSRADIGFDADANEVTIVEADGEHLVALAPKAEVADAVLDRVEALRSRVAK